MTPRRSRRAPKFSAGGFDAPQPNPLTPEPVAARQIIVLGLSVAFAVSIAAIGQFVVSRSPAPMNLSPAYRQSEPGFVCLLREKTECVPMSLYVDDSRPNVETLVAEASFPQHMRTDLRFRQDENGSLILRVRDEGGFGDWRDARLSDLAPPQSDYNESKKRAYSGTWRAGTNYRSRLIEELSASQRKTVGAYDRPKHSHLMQPLRANFLITTALPMLTDAPLLDLMELPEDSMERAQATFIRNHRIRQGQSL